MADAQNTQENAGKKVIGTPFKPGNPGKPPGTANKLTRTVKEAVLTVFNELQDDEAHSLTAFAKKHPRDFYNIAAKLIPTDIKADITAIVTLAPIVGMKFTDENEPTDTPAV